MTSTWKSIAIIVGIVIIIGVVVLYMSGNWEAIVNNALCSIQRNIGLDHHFHIPTKDGGVFACPYL